MNENLSDNPKKLSENGFENAHETADGTSLSLSDEYTAEDADIRFDPERDRQKKTEQDVKNVKKPKKAKWYFVIPVLLLIVVVVLFAVWHLLPKTQLNVCVLDKTVLTVEDGNDIDIRSVYRKHQGLMWILEQQRYVFEDGNFYDTKTDYFGPMLDENGQIKSYRELSSLDYLPDLMYVSDVYGAVDDTYGYYNKSSAIGSGVSVDDMAVISYAYENGATTVAEMELFNSNLDSSVYSQLTSLCGVKPTGWVGRYIYDLQDFTDVPDWAPPMYEKQEGVQWQFSGPGILLVSSEKIIILEQKTDFESKNLLKIRMNDGYKEEFSSCSSVNFYNWFEIVEPNRDTEVIASFTFDVNATGMEKLKGVLKTPTFAAAMRKTSEGKAPVYYFAGDFNDYVNHENYNRFLFADTVYRWISYDNAGDISNFYWNFYNPLMKKILSDIKPHEKASDDSAEKTAPFRMESGEFQIYSEDKWQDITLKTVAVNANEPGSKGYSRNYTFYRSLIDEAVNIGANCIYVKDIMPPEFYRALSSNNSGAKASMIYLIQNVDLPEGSSDDEAKAKLHSAEDILHGSGSFGYDNESDKMKYFADVSRYVAAITSGGRNVPDGYSYSGEYAAGTSYDGYGAFVYDTIEKYSAEKYGYKIPVGIYADGALMQALNFDGEGNYTGDYACNTDSFVSDNECRENYSFTAISFETADRLKSQGGAAEPAGESGEYSFVLGKLNSGSGEKLMVTGTAFSSANGMGSRAGVTEKQQGEQAVSFLSQADSSGVTVCVAGDLNDDWSAVSDELYPFTVPLENSYMWHNVADPAETSGFVALESVTPETSGINLADDDRVQMLSLSSNEGYFYISAQLLDDIDYSTEQLFIGIDTYQRNDGEYYYSSDYTPTALSGMEYVLRFYGKQQAELYVTRSYDRNAGNYATRESYSGEYDLVYPLEYGGFTSGDNQFYQTGSTVYIRIPWTWLNVTDPSQKVVLNNQGELSGQAKTVSTNGAIVSVLIADKQTGDQLYLFPETKQSPAYKTFKWATWEKVSYTVREKESFTVVKKYFSSK